MTRYIVQVAVGFAVGGLIAALGMIFSLVTLHYTRNRDPNLFSLIPIGAFFISGAIGGASLGRGWRPVIGFALAFGVVGLLSFPIVTGGFAEAVTGRNPGGYGNRGGGGRGFVPLLLFYVSRFGLLAAIPFGFAGAIGTRFSGFGWRLVLVGAGVFAVAGAIGGMVSRSVGYWPPSYRGDPPKFAVLVGFLITYALGGALFAVESEYTSRKRKKLGLCLKCGYDLQGLPKHGHQCPECGTPFELSVNKPPAVSVGVLNQEVNRLNRPQL